MKPLNLFYDEPDPDRWLPFDRYPRRIVRQLVRGPTQPGGQKRVFLNLCEGLDRIGVKYRVNEYSHAKKNKDELVCIIGKPFMLDIIKWQNPILFGAAIYSHPLEDKNLLGRLPIKKILVPGKWMREMCEPFWGEKVQAWPVGIDTTQWQPDCAVDKDIDVLIYDKVRWRHEEYQKNLIDPIKKILANSGATTLELRYGAYKEDAFHAALKRCKSMIFLCEHETQGIAYQQALSAGVPLFAWNRGGLWQDPSFYPDKVVFGPVSSVPYWDERCGLKFKDFNEFNDRWAEFWASVKANIYAPRDYIIDNLTLEICARKYVKIAQECM